MSYSCVNWVENEHLSVSDNTELETLSIRFRYANQDHDLIDKYVEAKLFSSLVCLRDMLWINDNVCFLVI